MPELSKVQFNMALVSSTKIGNEDDAIIHLNRAVRLDPYLALAFFERANIHSKLGDYSCALLDLDTAFKVYFIFSPFCLPLQLA
jgi:tetratricopeptide (TPR) repeat protein